MTTAVAPRALEWARDRGGRSDAQMRRKFSQWTEWLNGHEQPTMSQLRQVANYCHVPFGFMFAPDPPEPGLPVPDFRAGYGGSPLVPSAELLDVLYSCQRRQDWYRDYAIREGIPPREFVGSVVAGDDPQVVGSRIRAALRFEIADRRRAGHGSAWRRYVVNALERVGFLVVVSSMVGNNTYRLLNGDEFRGFSLSDRHAPLIFANARDTNNGQVFTLLHEAAHIWAGTSGVSGDSAFGVPESRIEQWCNAVASEVLVPGAELRRVFDPARAADDLDAELDRVAGYFNAGALVVLLKARSLGLYVSTDFDGEYERQKERLRSLATGVDSGKGGNFYANQKYRVGDRLGIALKNDVSEGNTSFVEAARLAGLNRGSFERFLREVGERSVSS